MDRIVGITAFRGLDDAARERAEAAQRRALAELPWLRTAELTVGSTELRAWGHGDVAAAIERLPDGGVAVVAGQPLPAPTAGELAALDGRVPWEGRLLVLRVAADGRRWDAFNDWSGSLPAFHAPAGDGWILSTLEPVVVAGAGLGPEKISRADLVALLVHGFFLGDRTLYGPMRVLAADVAATWGPEGFAARPQASLAPSDERWETGWDELADELQERIVAALRRGLEAEPAWQLPLSGGLDSRLIAAVAVQEGIPVEAWTYGPEDWLDVRYGRAAARMLGIPWHRVDLGTDYLARRTRTWGALFGSAMHFHGAYQFPLLEALGPGAGPIVTGYTGDPMGGAQAAGMLAGDRPPRRRFVDKWHMWDEAEVARLVRFDAAPALEELDQEIEDQLAALEGPLFQRLWIVFQHNHVARFSSYQPTMYDLWGGVGVPFVDRDLAAFTLSLPRAVLDDRRLQLHAFRRALPALATIPGTWSLEPAAPSGRWYLKKTLADLLPARLHRGPLAEFAPQRNTADQDALVASGEAGVWPLHEAWDALAEWVDLDLVAAAERGARAGDLQDMARLQAVQGLAWALLP